MKKGLGLIIAFLIIFLFYFFLKRMVKFFFKKNKTELIQNKKPFKDEFKNDDLLEVQDESYALIDILRQEEKNTGTFNIEKYRRLKRVARTEISSENSIKSLKNKNIIEAIDWFSKLKSRNMYFSNETYIYLNSRVNKELDFNGMDYKEVDSILYKLKEICKFRLNKSIYTQGFSLVFDSQESEFLPEVLNKNVLQAKGYLNARSKEFNYFSNKLFLLRDSLNQTEEINLIKRNIQNLQSRISNSKKEETIKRNKELLELEKLKIKNHINNLINEIF